MWRLALTEKNSDNWVSSDDSKITPNLLVSYLKRHLVVRRTYLIHKRTKACVTETTFPCPASKDGTEYCKLCARLAYVVRCYMLSLSLLFGFMLLFVILFVYLFGLFLIECAWVTLFLHLSVSKLTVVTFLCSLCVKLNCKNNKAVFACMYLYIYISKYPSVMFNLQSPTSFQSHTNKLTNGSHTWGKRTTLSSYLYNICWLFTIISVFHLCD